MTHPSEMSDAELNDAVALACGWTHTDSSVWTSGAWVQPISGSHFQSPPRYTELWAHCGPLIARYEFEIHPPAILGWQCTTEFIDGPWVKPGDDSDAALRRAICEAAVLVERREEGLEAGE